MRAIHAVACEDESSGVVDWYDNEEAAKIRYAALVGDITLAASNVTRFAFDAPVLASAEDITTEADGRMWYEDYVVIEQRT